MTYDMLFGLLFGHALALLLIVILLGPPRRFLGRRHRGRLVETDTPPPGWRGPRPKRPPKPVRPRRIDLPPPDEPAPYRRAAPRCRACGQAMPGEELEQ